jgi:hypothetical protein
LGYFFAAFGGELRSPGMTALEPAERHSRRILLALWKAQYALLGGERCAYGLLHDAGSVLCVIQLA